MKRRPAGSRDLSGPPRKAPRAGRSSISGDVLSAGIAFDRKIDESGSELKYDPAFANAKDAAAWAAALRDTVAWGQGRVKVFGKEHPEPRLTCYYGDPGISYTYSGQKLQPRPWNECPAIAAIKARVEMATGLRFNSVLCNRYRNGEDAMGWHADNEKAYGQNPAIASLTFGAERDFDLRENAGQCRKVRVALGHGSLLLMKGRTQHLWKHSLPRRKREDGERINLTFRLVVTELA